MNGDGIIVNIGDGILDANAFPPSDAFIGYTGVVFKEKAMSKALWIVDDFADLIEAIQN